LDYTGSETSWLQALINSRATVTVVLRSGDRLRGHVRYQDRDCFSIGLSPSGPRFLLRKENIAYIVEEPSATMPHLPPDEDPDDGADGMEPE